jgi:hypothetical protein
MVLAETISLWVGAILMLFAISFIFKNTIIFRIAEYTFVGGAAGHGVVMAVESLKGKAIEPLITGSFSLILALILGVLFFTRLTTGYSWLSRWPTSWLIGIGSGLTLRTILQAQLIEQIKSTIQPGFLSGNPADIIGNIILITGLVGTIWYFVFTVEKTGIKGNIAAYGRYIMMIAFGAGYGNSLQGRITYMVNVIFYLISDWLGLIK